jgi:DNA-binding transcriptional ArsR family regulator
MDRQAEPRMIATLGRHGSPLKRLILTVLTKFWQQIYQAEFAACLPVMQRSVETLARRPFPADFLARFQAITGRVMPDPMRQNLAGVRQMILVPSCHTGPYFVFAATPPTMQVSYNCRTAGSTNAGNGWVIELFPPLRALADETRLQILALLTDREMYAQEIIETLGISQSAASRHLQLLENTGVLAVRKENTAKYYTINVIKARELIAAIAELMNVT